MAGWVGQVEARPKAVRADGTIPDESAEREAARREVRLLPDGGDGAGDRHVRYVFHPVLLLLG